MSRARPWVILLAVTFVAMVCLAMLRGERVSSEAGGDEATAADGTARANMSEMEKEFAKAMSGATLRGLATTVRAGSVVGQNPDEYTLGDVTKVDDRGRWKFEFRTGDDRLLKTPPLDVHWAGETPVIVFSDIRIKGRQGTFSAKLLIDDDQYVGTWSDGKSGGHMFGTIVYVKAKKAKKPKQPNEDEKET
ncbi:MAG TPA: hypothetical protein VND64_37615 [Pirellulales bacterium]|nr:hypothetical protein [Pirellulales bacterium]